MEDDGQRFVCPIHYPSLEKYLTLCYSAKKTSYAWPLPKQDEVLANRAIAEAIAKYPVGETNAERTSKEQSPRPGAGDAQVSPLQLGCDTGGQAQVWSKLWIF
jgi:hypothetical protein